VSELLARVPRVREVENCNLGTAQSDAVLQSARYRFNIYVGQVVWLFIFQVALGTILQVKLPLVEPTIQR